MFSEQEVRTFVSTIHDMRNQAQVLLEAGVAHVIGLPTSIQLYEGISSFAEILGVQPQVQIMGDSMLPYKYKALFEFEGIEFMQLGSTPEEALKGVECGVQSEV